MKNGMIPLENLICFLSKPAICMSGYLSKGNKKIGHTKMYMQMLTATLFIITIILEATWISLNWWVSKLCYIHTTEQYSAIKIYKMHATTRMNLKNNMLSEISQIQKRMCCVTPFTWNSRKAKTIVTKSRHMAPSFWEIWGGDFLQKAWRILRVMAIFCTFILVVMDDYI